MAQKWEYQILDIKYMTDEKLGKVLTELGKNGWEIAMDREIAGSTSSIVMKRPEDEKFPKETKEMERQAELQINEEEWPEVAFPRK